MEVSKRELKVAFVHDWLDSYRGGEKVLEYLLELFPDAPIFTLFFEPTNLPTSILRRNVYFPKFLNPLRKFRRLLLPILPHVVESFDLREFNLIISTSSCVAKGVIPAPYAKHICYLHSPMRYVWDQQREYLKGRILGTGLAASLFQLLAVQLRMWDVVSASRVDRFVANSNFVRQRVRRFYAREASVLNPPISDDFLSQKVTAEDRRHEYYLVVGALVSYKRFDLAIEACKRLDRKLIVVGRGQQERFLKSISGSNTEFVAHANDEMLHKYMRNARALIFPGVEDFGLTGVEAISCGTPVIALRAGGALDFVEEGLNGMFFETPSIESLERAIRSFEATSFNPLEVSKTAQKFSKRNFQMQFLEEIKMI